MLIYGITCQLKLTSQLPLRHFDGPLGCMLISDTHVWHAVLQDVSWNAGKKSMGNVDAFLKSLVAFDKDNTPLQCVERVEKDFLSNPNFNADYIRSKSGAAAGLCGWVVNICKYFRIYQVTLTTRLLLHLGAVLL